MNKYLLTIFLLVCTNIFSQTQAEMNQEAINDFKKADIELNELYNKVIKRLDLNQRKLLNIAQKKWIAFRDAHCKFEIEEYEGGTIQPLMHYSCLASITNERIDDLNEILKNIE